ncbi:class II glutamine amidotransferase [Vibrio atlanticus]|uniref:Predicted glutamine amidotransferase n=1 Tax=Vibrio atlanticus (strain LGP32) TaxID=575788 RepID=B7VT40_VIBA3|nr:class II glutamine amidotransferase [Vibrio atlanticus]CAV27319.1 Predicted glutamine amidotransferase [Vibrio atlanticus]
MCRWLAYQGVPIYLDEVIYVPEHSLINQSLEARKGTTRLNADGFGLGWYTQRDTPGQFREVLPAWGDDNLRSLAHHISSHRFMAHIRSSTGSVVSRSNCHPFIVDNWMFMHNGQIDEFEKLRFQLERLLPESLYHYRLGTTDSELIFLLMIKNGLFSNANTAIISTIKEIEMVKKNKSILSPFKASICLSDGEQFWVVRYCSDAEPPTIYIKAEGINVSIASEPLEKSNDWKLLRPQTITRIHDSELTTEQIQLED